MEKGGGHLILENLYSWKQYACFAALFHNEKTKKQSTQRQNFGSAEFLQKVFFDLS
jgi:hypothetical protein